MPPRQRNSTSERTTGGTRPRRAPEKASGQGGRSTARPPTKPKPTPTINGQENQKPSRPFRPPFRKRRKKPQNGMQSQNKASTKDGKPTAASKYEAVHGKRLRPLKTLAELRTSNDTAVEALVIEIPTKLANNVLSLLRPILPTSPLNRSFSHIRRLVAWKYLPEYVQSSFAHSAFPAVYLLLPPPLPLLPEVSIPAALEGHCDGQKPRLGRANVPTDSPKDLASSEQWSKSYWPTVYNPAAQPLTNAPPLHLLRTVIAELEKDDGKQLDFYMELARAAASEGDKSGKGKPVGVVIVDPSKNTIVAVAGDQRWLKDGLIQDAEVSNTGRPEHHALMRAVEFVAMAERNRRGMKPSNASITKEILGSVTPLEAENSMPPDPVQATDEEELVDQMGNLQVSSVPRSGGYLCTGLDVYMTHEPCICCAMAMLHSRFRACIFDHKMDGAGGLCGEQENGGLGYGMFWKRELNWRTLTFHMKPVETEKPNERNKEIFHA
ncbi:MAG: hypothetical protein Q9227_004609 [Pyrenula ochraceoflavens]